MNSIIDALQDEAAFLKDYLKYGIIHVPVKDKNGSIINSFAAVQIPDWNMKQRLQELDMAIIAIQKDAEKVKWLLEQIAYAASQPDKPSHTQMQSVMDRYLADPISFVNWKP